MKFYFVDVLILTVWSLSNCQPVEQSTNINSKRLPTNIYPINYNIFITTYLPGFEWNADERSLTYEGYVIIDLEVKESTDKIILHSDSTEIVNAGLLSNNSEIIHWKLTPDDQFLTFYLNRTLEKGTKTQIFIEFRGKLRNDLKGFYLTDSLGTNGETIRNAVTQFETTDARLMIPCFDEPEFKATWQVSLAYPTGAVGLTNGIEERTFYDGNFTKTKYRKTVKMSSYLLAIFVGDVQYKETKTDGGLRIRVYADPQNVDYIDHALNVSKLTVEGFEQLFGIGFPMEKLDFVSVKRSGASAMENWGLIVHKSTSILGSSEYVSEVVIHELAHQWFGNLVTMKFWNQVWLNEGFATYMTMYGISSIYSNSNFDFSFVNYQEKAKANDHDLTLNSVDTHNDGSIGVPNINYSKGSSFIRMLEKVIGTDNLLKGIREYLSENSYSNTEDIDLYKSLERFYNRSENDPSLEEFGRCWTHQNGFPTVHVETINGKTILTQRKYIKIDSEYESFNECGYKWDIPIWYQKFGEEEIRMEWFTKDKNELELNVDGFLIVNANSYGYYDVVYSDSSYESIAAEFRNNSQMYSDSTKFRVLKDIMLYEYSENYLHSALLIVDSLKNSRNFGLLKSANQVVTDVKKKLSFSGTDEDLEMIKRFETKLIEGNAFEGCEPSETFSSCYQNNFKMFSDACSAMKLYGNDQTSDRLLKWLKIEETDGNKEQILNLLDCGFWRILIKVLNDKSYNWPLYIRQKFPIYFQRKERKLAEIGKQPKSRSFMDFESFNQFIMRNSNRLSKY
uniref:Aminopeptidase n=1 Tax=Caenorhabditis tropicalis TaxID=1561998 RepID=A0A1I7TQP8_9PELO